MEPVTNAGYDNEFVFDVRWFCRAFYAGTFFGSLLRNRTRWYGINESDVYQIKIIDLS